MAPAVLKAEFLDWGPEWGLAVQVRGPEWVLDVQGQGPEWVLAVHVPDLLLG